jgi:N-methylhydantoinase B
MGAAIDPVLLEVLRNRLDAIADEMELTLLKSAASPIVKEGLDASAALFNTQGETIAQAAAIPIHLGALQLAAQRIVRAFPPERMREGDAFLLNDPYDGGTHLPDITLAVPVVAWPWRARCVITRTWAVARRAACPPTPPSSTRRA